MAESIIVTGAAGTLGQAVVAELARAGFDPLGLDLADDMPDCGQSSFVGGVDLADEGQAAAAIARLAGGRTSLAGLANVAGGFAWETVGDGAIETWERMHRTNVTTTLACSRAALPLLRAGGGAIVNIGANGAVRAAAGMGAYAASKSAVARLTEALAEEEKESGVRVNAVLPTIIDTPANRRDLPNADFGEWVQPQAIAEVIVFLLSPASRAITGACITVSLPG